MFRPVPMLRLRAVVLARQERAVLRCLGGLGAIQLTRIAAGTETAPVNPPDRSRELAQCDRLLARIGELRRALGLGVFTGTALAVMSREEAERKLGEWEDLVGAWVRRREELQRQAQEAQERCEQLRPYRGLDLPLNQLGAASFLHYVTGTLPPGAVDQMTLGKETVLLPLPLHQGRQPVVAFGTSRTQTALAETLRLAGFQPELLPVREGLTPESIVADDQRAQEKLTADLAVVNQEGRALAATAMESLSEIQQWAIAERRLYEAEEFSPRTEASVLMSGWIPASEAPSVRGALRECTGGCCMIDVTDAQDVPEEEVPVLLRHSRLLRPFEMLLNAYGLPRYGELVPTLFVAVSYVLMFGMMFGDVGHGGLLALVGGVLLLSGHAASRHDLGLLLLVNGLSSAAFGAAYGSYFGLPELKEHALWRDPLEGDPMTLMLLAIGLGVVLMSVGLVLNIMNRLRRGEWVEGLIDKFGVIGVIFYWGTLALVTRSAAIQAQGWWTWALLLFVAVPILCWAVKEPWVFWRHPHPGHDADSGGMVGAVAESLVGAFEGVLLYVANTISFVRLAAYAMSHAALLMATFSLAEQVRGLSSGGTTLGILVIVMGNAIAIVLEGIVAAVQALRLEYYEFFGKFFSGDGQPFRPFLLNGGNR